MYLLTYLLTCAVVVTVQIFVSCVVVVGCMCEFTLSTHTHRDTHTHIHYAGQPVASMLRHCRLSIRKSVQPMKNWVMVIWLKRGAIDLHIVQLMPLPPRLLLLH